jgi:hypothetical protein
MQNAGPESLRSRLSPALAGLALTLLAAAPAAAADAAPAARWAALPRHAATLDERPTAWLRWPVRPAVFAVGLAPDAPGKGWPLALGLAFSLGGGVSLGAGGGVGPAGDARIAVIVLEIAF